MANDEAADQGKPDSTRVSESRFDMMLRQAGQAIKVLFFAMAFAYVAFHWKDLSDWLSTITHGEAFGIKFDRQAVREKIEKIPGEKISPNAGASFASGAVARAARAGSAVAGARILWLDTYIDRNLEERQVLEAMHISVQRAQSAKEAEDLARQAASDNEPYDLIISNISGQPGDRPLKVCSVTYSKIPSGVRGPQTLPEFNAEANTKPRVGFAFAEALAANEVTAKAYMQIERPRLIFYTAANGALASTTCARLITSYADLLLQDVVSALEEARWQKLPPIPQSSKTASDLSD